MMKMIKHIKYLCVITFISVASCTQQAKNDDDKLPVNAIAVPVKKGWGYEIYVDNKLFIKQNYIPAVSGNHQFENKDQALVTANLVLTKMKEGKKPFITTEELKHAGINIAN